MFKRKIILLLLLASCTMLSACNRESTISQNEKTTNECHSTYDEEEDYFYEYEEGYEQGHFVGYGSGFDQGYEEGYADGYDDGYKAGCGG